MCCAEIPWKALVKSATVPTDPEARAVMEAQIRQAYTVPAIYEPLGYGPMGAKICATFAKETLTAADLAFTKLSLMGPSASTWADQSRSCHRCEACGLRPGMSVVLPTFAYPGFDV